MSMRNMFAVRTLPKAGLVIGAVLLLSLLVSGQELKVAPAGNQIKRVGKGAIFTCSLTDYNPPRDGQHIQWKSPAGTSITATKGRVYVEKNGARRLRLYITNIQEDDAGLYTCEADVNGNTLFVDTTLVLFADIAFLETETTIQSSEGTSVLLPCVATGQPEPRITWRHNRRRIVSDDTKFVYEAGGLRVYNVEYADNGTYECRAEVENQGNLKVRFISLDVQFPPKLITKPVSSTVVQGESITLTCEATGNPEVTYEWFREQKMNKMIKIKVRLDSETEQLTIKSMKESDVGRYFCKTSNSLGEREEYADLDMIIPPNIRDLPEKVELEGRTVIIPCEASGDPLPIITWQRHLQSASDRHEYREGVQPDDGRVTVDSTQPGVSKLIIRDIQRSYSGVYSCTAKNEAGIDSKMGSLTVEFKPTVNTSDTEKLGWVGQTRNFTCEGYGLPLPTMNWFRGGQYISKSDSYTIHNTVNKTVTSILEVKLTNENKPWVYGQYSCIGKNQYGYVTKQVTLKEATVPDAPANVTIISETPTTVTFKADTPANTGGKPITSWSLRYHEVGSEEDTVTNTYKEVTQVMIRKLKGGKTYMFFLTASNIIGEGRASKFKIKTPKRAPREQTPADVPAKTPDVVQQEANYTYVDATKGKKPVDSVREAMTTPESSHSMYIAIGVTAVVAVAIIFTVIILLAMRKRKHRIPDHKFYNGTPNGNATTVCVQGKEVDNIQLQIHRKDSAEIASHKSPLQSRKHMVKTAGTPCLPTPQQATWDQMLMRQDIADDDDEIIEGVAQDDLPPPPDYLLADMPSGGDHAHQSDDAGSYHDVLDGYHSEDNNVDDVDMEAPFHGQVHYPNMYGQPS